MTMYEDEFDNNESVECYSGWDSCNNTREPHTQHIKQLTQPQLDKLDKTVVNNERVLATHSYLHGHTSYLYTSGIKQVGSHVRFPSEQIEPNEIDGPIQESGYDVTKINETNNKGRSSNIHEEAELDDTEGYFDNLCEQLESIGIDGPMQESGEEVKDMPYTSDYQEATSNEQTKLNAISVYTQDQDGDTALHISIILQNSQFAIECINISPTNTWLSVKNHLFQTPLHLAVLTKQPLVVRRLVVGGANIESRDKDGNTALHIACRECLREIVEALLEPVRYIETKQNRYEIPYQRIPQNLAITNYEGRVCLHLAALNGHLEMVKILIQNGADINAMEGKTGRTILHNACLDGDLQLVKLLLCCPECNINARTYDDFTPFDFARTKGQGDIIMVLAAAGVRYGAEDDDMSEN